jgi:hypothetical protein
MDILKICSGNVVVLALNLATGEPATAFEKRANNPELIRLWCGGHDTPLSAEQDTAGIPAPKNVRAARISCARPWVLCAS